MVISRHEEIKPCPFCGGVGNLWQNWSKKTRSYFVMVKCDFCNAQGKTFRSEEEPAETDWGNDACRRAVAAWNMRKGEEPEGSDPIEKMVKTLQN